MRFSLLTLILLVVAAGTGMAVWFLRGPWNVGETPTENPVNGRKLSEVSPDELRIVVRGQREVCIARQFNARYVDEKGPVHTWMVEGRSYLTGTILLCHTFDSTIVRAGFIDDNTVSVELIGTDNQAPARYCIIRRRFPESTYGHLFRPEVWLFLIAIGFWVASMLVDLTRHRREKNAAAPFHPPSL